MRTFIAAAVLVATTSIGLGAPVTVAVFDNGAYVDTASGATSDESDMIQASLTALGHTVTTFTGFAAADWSAAAASADVILMPELRGNLPGAMNAADLAGLAAAIASGTGFVIAGSTMSYDESLLNSAFGWSLTSGGSAGTTYLDAGAAAGTAFAGGPASLPYMNQTENMSTGSLPAGAIAYYASGSQTTVFTAGFGAGRVGYLGWDWFSAAPVGSADGGWNTVLDSMVTDVTNVPEPGTMALLGLGLAGMGLVVRRRRRAAA